MTNDSSTGGLLVSYQDSYIALPLEGQTLLNFLQEQLVGITGLPGNMVRPRWQPEPPNLPAATVDWLAFGITERVGETNAYTYHETPHLDELPRTLDHINPVTGQPDLLDPPDFDIVIRNENFTVLCSLYGPNADLNASLLREGFSVAQNREALQLQGTGFVAAGTVTPVPSLVNDKWYYRVDLPLQFRRHIRRVYPVLDILSVPGEVDTDTVTRTINVTSND